jgi:hypothetical protein
MEKKDIVLNIAVNMGRLGRFSSEKRENRCMQFLSQTEEYLILLEKEKVSNRFQNTLTRFRSSFDNLKKDVRFDQEWSEEAYTWANILTHRAKLA